MNSFCWIKSSRVGRVLTHDSENSIDIDHRRTTLCHFSKSLRMIASCGVFLFTLFCLHRLLVFLEVLVDKDSNFLSLSLSSNFCSSIERISAISPKYARMTSSLKGRI